MTRWNRTEPKPQPWRRELYVGNSLNGCNLYLSPNDSGKTFQSLSVSVCRSAERGPDDCERTWPAEAIATARRLLDELEAVLEQEPAR